MVKFLQHRGVSSDFTMVDFGFHCGGIWREEEEAEGEGRDFPPYLIQKKPGQGPGPGLRGRTKKERSAASNATDLSSTQKYLQFFHRGAIVYSSPL